MNGGNVVFYDEQSDVYHMYFVDLKQVNDGHSVLHAISKDGKHYYSYQNIALSEPGHVVNDMKRINGYYVLHIYE